MTCWVYDVSLSFPGSDGDNSTKGNQQKHDHAMYMYIPIHMYFSIWSNYIIFKIRCKTV